MPQDESIGLVPKELRRTLKKAKGAKTLLMELEEEVRKFVVGWERRAARAEKGREGRDTRKGKGRNGYTDADAMDSTGNDTSDEEVVFVGRNGAMRDVPASPTTTTTTCRRLSGDLELEEVVYGVEGMGIDDADGDADVGMQKEKLVFGAAADDRAASFGWVVFPSFPFLFLFGGGGSVDGNRWTLRCHG